MGFQIFNKKVRGRSNFSQLINLILFLQIKKIVQFLNYNHSTQCNMKITAPVF